MINVIFINFIQVQYDFAMLLTKVDQYETKKCGQKKGNQKPQRGAVNGYGGGEKGGGTRRGTRGYVQPTLVHCTYNNRVIGNEVSHSTSRHIYFQNSR